MSLRSRARALQRVTGLTYQQALDRIRALGSAPAELARARQWPLTRCDAFLVRPDLDPEPWLSVVARPIRVEAVAQAKTLGGLCEELLVTTEARMVVLVGRDGAWLARAGVMGVELMMTTFSMLRGPRPTAPQSVSFFAGIDGGVNVFSCALAGGQRLVVLFDERSSLGLVRLRAAAAVRELERLLAFQLPVPRRGGDSGSGAPAQVSAFDGIFDRDGKVGSSS